MFESNNNLHRLQPRGATIDSVKVRHRELGTKTDLPLLERAARIYENMDAFRKQAMRCYMYTFGDQWGEYIEVDGKPMTQREYLVKQGNVALQSNQIKSKVNTIVGTMLKERNEPVCNARDRDEQQYGEVMTIALQANCYKNSMDLVYSKLMTDLVVRGMCVSREVFETRDGFEDTWTDRCEPFRMFIDNNMNDPRCNDMTIIGRFFDVPFSTLTTQFAHSPADYERLRRIFPDQADIHVMPDIDFRDEGDKLDKLDFWETEDLALCRVYEVWTKETRPRYRVHDTNEAKLEIVDASDAPALKAIKEENRKRQAQGRKLGWAEDEIPLIEMDYFVDTFWYVRFMAKDGTVIWEGESPLADRSHPFSVCILEGMQGYITDSIDHQILINRTIVLQDWLIRAQAKGITVVPKQLVPDDMTSEDFATSYISLDNMLFVDWKPGVPMPQTLTGAAQTFPANQLIEQYTKLLESSTAVSGALQGKTPYSGTSAALYAQQTANSSTPLFSLLSKFRAYMESVALKKMKNIAMFYDEQKFERIAGRIDGIFDNQNINLNEVGEIEYDLSIKESTETPVYRMVANDTLMQFLQLGAVSPEEVLEYGYFPFADKLLQARQARQAEIEAVQGDNQVDDTRVASEQVMKQMQKTQDERMGIDPRNVAEQEAHPEMQR